jgi:phosphatidylserine/phosphatidylglycerophosphate/cardiolipin synthase-like enzyme
VNNLEKKVVAFVIVALLTGGIIGYYFAQPYDEIARLESEISILQSDYEELDALYDELFADNTELELLLEIEVLGVYFSPHGGAASQVINWIDRANETIHVLIYSFTNDDIGDAILRAHQRGVEIKVVFEKSQVSQYSEYMKLRSEGVLVRNDTNSKLMHHKVAVIDSHILLTGSFNWSAAAESSNNENFMVIKSETLVTTFEEEFQKIWSSSA